jgi:hypothetical protein
VVEKLNRNVVCYNLAATPGIYYRVGTGLMVYADCGGIAYSYTHNTDRSWSFSISAGFLQSVMFGMDFVINNAKKHSLNLAE